MRRPYVKPTLMIEEFELTQDIAAGCATVIAVVLNDTEVQVGCDPALGEDHWTFSGTYRQLIEAGDGKVKGEETDWKLTEKEYAYACANSGNSYDTAVDHKDHVQKLIIGDKTIRGANPFNS